jgi:hypothetical protein
MDLPLSLDDAHLSHWARWERKLPCSRNIMSSRNFTVLEVRGSRDNDDFVTLFWGVSIVAAELL